MAYRATRQAIKRTLAMVLCVAVLWPALAIASCDADCQSMTNGTTDVMSLNFDLSVGGCDTGDTSSTSQHCDSSIGQCSYFGPTPLTINVSVVRANPVSVALSPEQPIWIAAIHFRPPRA